MLYGTVAYELRDGGKASVDWAAHAKMVLDEEGRWRLGFYQVYLVGRLAPLVVEQWKGYGY